MSTYIQLKNQIRKLEKEAELVRKRELTETIANIKKAISAYGLTAEELGLSDSARNRIAGKSSKKTVGQGIALGAKLRGRPPKTKATPKVGRKRAREAMVDDKRKTVAPKYRDSATGTTWTGRGKIPKWLSAAIETGKRLEDFAI